MACSGCARRRKTLKRWWRWLRGEPTERVIRRDLFIESIDPAGGMATVRVGGSEPERPRYGVPLPAEVPVDPRDLAADLAAKVPAHLWNYAKWVRFQEKVTNAAFTNLIIKEDID